MARVQAAAASVNSKVPGPPRALLPVSARMQRSPENLRKAGRP